MVRSPIPFGLGRNGCWPSRGSQLPRALPSQKPFFRSAAPLNNHRRAAHSFSKIGRLSSPFSCPSWSSHSSPSLDERQRSSQPWPHFSLFSVRWKGDLVGKVSAMLHLLQMGPFKLLSFSKFRTLGGSHSWSFPPAASLLLLEITL